jgi:hypothetical protein
VFSDTDLYRRGIETLLASWDEYAHGATGAALQRLPGVATAVFPNEPERAVYNNAILELDLAAAQRTEALDAMEAEYAAAGVTRFAAWVHESSETMRGDLARRGYKLADSTVPAARRSRPLSRSGSSPMRCHCGYPKALRDT